MKFIPGVVAAPPASTSTGASTHAVAWTGAGVRANASWGRHSVAAAATEANKGAGQHYNEVGTDGESQNTPPRQRGDNKPPDEPHTLESDARQGSVANGRQHTTSAYTLGD